MTITAYRGLRLGATGGGVIALALEGYANVAKLLSGGLDWYSPAVLTAGAMAGLGAVAIAIAVEAVHKRRWLYAGMLLLAVVLSLSSGFYNSFESLLLGRETFALDVKKHNAAVTAARVAKDQADAEVRRLSQAVTAETLNKGCKSICRGLQAQLVEARTVAQAAAGDLAKVGPVRAENIVAETLGVPAVVAEATPTMLTAFALLAFAVLLPWFVHAGREVAVETPSEVSADATLDVQSERAAIKRVLAALKDEAQSNDELARRLGVPKGTASKWATAAEDAGLIRRHRDGREVRIRRVA